MLRYECLLFFVLIKNVIIKETFNIDLDIYDEDTAHRADQDTKVLSDVWLSMLPRIIKDNPEMKHTDLAKLKTTNDMLKHEFIFEDKMHDFQCVLAFFLSFLRCFAPLLYNRLLSTSVFLRKETGEKTVFFPEFHNSFIFRGFKSDFQPSAVSKYASILF